MPVDGLGVPSVARQRHVGRAPRKVPDADRGVVGRRRELQVGRRKRHGADGLPVRLDRLDELQVRPPVLDRAGVVAADHPVVVVGEAHGPDRALVRLQDRGEAEGRAVPQGELAAGGGREAAPPFRSPHDGVDRAAGLVDGHVDERGGRRGRGRRDVGGRGQQAAGPRGRAPAGRRRARGAARGGGGRGVEGWSVGARAGVGS